MKPTKPLTDSWPTTALSYYLGRLNKACDVYAIVDNGRFIGSDMIDFRTGLAVSADRDPRIPYDDAVRNLMDGMLESAGEERYELAAMVRDLLKILGVDTLNLSH